VLVHLLQNAVQHSRRGGEVRLGALNLMDGGCAWVEITVQDRGPGIEPAAMARLFQPFFSQRRGGAGLGLAIARHIVDAHGGTIEAHNRPDGGARFRLRLPALEAAAG
jgi:signal transduction histidine kinase